MYHLNQNKLVIKMFLIPFHNKIFDEKRNLKKEAYLNIKRKIKHNYYTVVEKVKAV